MKVWMNDRMNGWMTTKKRGIGEYKQTNKWVKKWMNEWSCEWMTEWTDTWSGLQQLQVHTVRAPWHLMLSMSLALCANYGLQTKWTREVGIKEHAWTLVTCDLFCSLSLWCFRQTVKYFIVVKWEKDFLQRWDHSGDGGYVCVHELGFLVCVFNFFLFYFFFYFIFYLGCYCQIIQLKNYHFKSRSVR